MFGEILLVELVGNDPPTFNCRTRDGKSPRICSIAVSDLEAESQHESRLWFLVAIPDEAKNAFEAALRDAPPEDSFITEPIEARIIGEPVPLEEWRPDHPNVVAAMDEIRSQLEKVVVPVAEIRYGEAPPGFYQCYPRTGKPNSLTADHRYEIVVQGFDIGRLEFKL